GWRWWASWERSASRPRWRAGWPPPHGASASGPRARRGACPPPGRWSTPRISPTNAPRRPKREWWQPGGDAHSGRRSRTSARAAGEAYGDRRSLLLQAPPMPYAQISVRLGIPVGSIGPSRARCLEKLRQHPALAALINAEAGYAR